MSCEKRSRRTFLRLSIAASLPLLTKHSLYGKSRTQMSKVERVKAILRGERVDRLPFTFWNHFGLEKLPGEKHAEATLAFYRRFDIDLLKVMSDFPYPYPDGQDELSHEEDWEKLEASKNPFPEQVKALRIINKELKGQAPFVETIFHSWTVAEKLSSKEAIRKLKEENPKLLKKALRVISESQANHARLAVDAGAAGIFLAVAAADDVIMDSQEYMKLGRESDLIILDAVKDQGYLNILHIHGKKPHFDLLLTYPVQVVNYSSHATGVDLASIKKRFSGTLMGGLDETRIASLSVEEISSQIQRATLAMQKRRLILAPGCSVPNDIPEGPLLKIKELIQKG